MTVELTEATGTDLAAVRELVAAGEIVLVRDQVTEEAAQTSRLDQWPRDVAESVGECALVPVAGLTGGDSGQRYPFLVGPKESVRFLCSFADTLPPAPFPYETRPTRTDYREFRDRWITREPQEPNAFMFQLGEVMAGMHRKMVLHGDAHLGNWLMVRGQVVVGDNDLVFLHCVPTPAQCATDIAPLLPELSASSWMNFRTGYLHTWQEPEGQRVIDLIQLGDRTGWAVPFRAGEFARAVALLDRQLAEVDTPVERVLALLHRVLALSRCGRHAEALQDCLDAASLARQHCPHVAGGLALVQAVAFLDQGDRDGAVELLRGITNEPDRLLARYEPADARLPIITL